MGAALGRRGDAVVCRCGHPRAAHRHYRPGSDCALCPPGSCPRFRRRWLRLPFRSR